MMYRDLYTMTNTQLRAERDRLYNNITHILNTVKHADALTVETLDGYENKIRTINKLLLNNQG